MSDLSNGVASGEDAPIVDLDLARQVLHELRAFQEHNNLDVEHVDGEFFYRCCVPKLEGYLKRARAIQHPDPGEHIAALNSAAMDMHVYFGLPDSIGFPSLVYGRPLRMRTPELEAVVGPLRTDDGLFPITTHVSMKVHSSSVRGREVARAMTGRRWRHMPVAPDAEGDVSFRWTLISTSPELKSASDGEGPAGVPDAPYIQIVVGVPLPKAESIAFLYDAEIRARRVHEELSHGAGQKPATAMRTWMIAFYMASGLPFYQANDCWLQDTATEDEDEDDDEDGPGLSQAKFNRDRDRLLSRVPEAKPYLV